MQMGRCTVAPTLSQSLLCARLLEILLLLANAVLLSGFCINNFSSARTLESITLQTNVQQYELSSSETHISTTVANITSDSVLNFDNYEDIFLFNVDLDDSLLDGTACSSQPRREYSDDNDLSPPSDSWLVARLWFGGAHAGDGDTFTEYPGSPNLRLRLSAEKHPNCEQSDKEADLIFDAGYERGLQQIVVKSPKRGSNERIRILVQKMKLTPDNSPANKNSLHSSHAPLQFALVNVTVSCATQLTMEPCMTSYASLLDVAMGARARPCYGQGTCMADSFGVPKTSSGLMRSHCECDSFHTGFACQYPLVRLTPEQFINVTVPLRKWVHLYVSWVPSERPPLFAEATLLAGFPRYSMDSYGSPFILCVQPLPEYGEDPVSLTSDSRQLGAHCDMVGAAAGRVSHSKSHATNSERAMVYLISIYGREILYDNLFVTDSTYSGRNDQRIQIDASMGVSRILAPQLVNQLNVMVRASWFDQPCPSYWNSGPCNGTGECQVLKSSQWQKGDFITANSEMGRQYSAFNNNLTIYQEQAPPAVCRCRVEQGTGDISMGYNCQSYYTLAFLDGKRPWRHSGLIGWPLSEIIDVRLPDKKPACIEVAMYPLPCLSVWDPQAGNERLLFSEDMKNAGHLKEGVASGNFTEYRSVMQVRLDVSRFAFQTVFKGPLVVRLFVNGQNCWPACRSQPFLKTRSYFGSTDTVDPLYHRQDCPSLEEAMAKSAQPYYNIAIDATSSCTACEKYRCPRALTYKYNMLLLVMLGGLPVLAICIFVCWRRRLLGPRTRTDGQIGYWRRQTSVPDSVIKTFTVYKYNPAQPLPKKTGTASEENVDKKKLSADANNAHNKTPFQAGGTIDEGLPESLPSTDVSITIGVGMLSASQTLSSSTASALSQRPDPLLTQSGSLALSQELHRSVIDISVPTVTTNSMQSSACEEQHPPASQNLAMKTFVHADSAGLQTDVPHDPVSDANGSTAESANLVSQAEVHPWHVSCVTSGNAPEIPHSLSVQTPATNASCDATHDCMNDCNGINAVLKPSSMQEEKESHGGLGESMEERGESEQELNAKLHTLVDANCGNQGVSSDDCMTGERVSGCQDSLSTGSVDLGESGAAQLPPLTFSPHSPIPKKSSHRRINSSSRVTILAQDVHHASDSPSTGLESTTRSGNLTDLKCRKVALALSAEQQIACCTASHAEQHGHSPCDVTCMSKSGMGPTGDGRVEDELNTSEAPENGHTPIDDASADLNAGARLEIVELRSGPVRNAAGSTTDSSPAESGTAATSYGVLQALTNLISMQRRRRSHDASQQSAGRNRDPGVVSSTPLGAAGNQEAARPNGSVSIHMGSTTGAVQNPDRAQSSPSSLPYRPLDPFPRFPSSFIRPQVHAAQNDTSSSHPSTPASANTRNSKDGAGSFPASKVTQALTFARDDQAAQHTHADAEEDPDCTCMICLVEYEEEDEVMMLPCWHAFHKECIVQWMANHVTCPACRHCLVPGPEEESGGPG